MSEVREFLLAALKRVVDGGDIQIAELDAAIPDPLKLDKIEKDAWEQLSHWVDDEDIRAKDENYAAFKREWMRQHIASLST
ncbi:hypothetical protein [Sphingomicrobium flavum]|uniref:hypothetical protein n=1 Tax=Sphingomicrobium flavum TaxID=1229164 RepID=UPI0021AE0D21|nr:hypothetical protein [Sphingomicrobium flavum]